MTEAEWLTATDPRPMLAFLRGSVSDRKLRLFAVFCRNEYLRFRPDLSGGIGFRFAAMTERYADDEATFEEWNAIRQNVHGTSHYTDAYIHATWEIETAIACCYTDDSVRDEQTAAEYAILANVVRDIVGDPFRPVALDPAWRTEAVVGLAAGIYADRAFDRLPDLADALEAAGCADAAVLTHCRGPGPHVRGCWVVDLLLGKS
jgi:hypothetical protein